MILEEAQASAPRARFSSIYAIIILSITIEDLFRNMAGIV